MNRLTATLAALPLAALLMLPACSGKKAEPVPDNETNGVAVVEDHSALENIDEPDASGAAPVETSTNTAKALPAPKVSDEAQVAEDADATGLTARIDQPSGNETQPAQ